MTQFILRILGLSPAKEEKSKDDFGHFFTKAKSAEKVKVIRRVMREATAEQERVLKEYRERVSA